MGMLMLDPFVILNTRPFHFLFHFLFVTLSSKILKGGDFEWSPLCMLLYRKKILKGKGFSSSVWPCYYVVDFVANFILSQSS